MTGNDGGDEASGEKPFQGNGIGWFGRADLRSAPTLGKEHQDNNCPESGTGLLQGDRREGDRVDSVSKHGMTGKGEASRMTSLWAQA